MFLLLKEKKMKYKFKEGQEVLFDIPGYIHGRGIICGIAQTGVSTLWIVKLIESNVDKDEYSYSCAPIQEQHLKAYE